MKHLRRESVVSRLKGLASILDNFNRSNGSLGFGGGTSSVPWKTVRGSWGITSNAAVTSSNASVYPLATLQFTKTDVTLGIDGVTYGAGTAFWVTDSNNWWASYLDNNNTCSTCANTSNVATYVTNSTYVPASGGNCSTYTTNCSCYNPGNYAGYYYARGCGASSCSYPYQTPCSSSFCGGSTCCRAQIFYYNLGNCCGYSASCSAYNAYVPAYTTYSYSPSTYNAVTYYSCNCVDNPRVNIIQSVAGTISNIVTFALSSAAVGFKTILSGNNVTIRAYSNNLYTNQIGSDQTQTVTSPVKTKTHGILVAPTTYSPSQTLIVDNFSVS